ncbi:MAG: GNAT family N-acetyltransferase [Elusimicrobiota bacterium]
MILRRARRADVPDLVALLRDDELGSGGESAEGEPLPDSYYAAFDAIDRDPAHELMIAEIDGRVAGSFQLTILPHLAGQGRPVAQIESVHVLSSFRRRGVGGKMMAWAVARAEEKGCRRVQLTSNKKRRDAHRFYERLGFHATHEGFKRSLRPGRAS